jgi:hypothetical protein
MSAAGRLRTLSTWLLLAGALVAAATSVPFLRQLGSFTRPHLEAMDPKNLPAFTAAVLGHFDILTRGLWLAAIAVAFASGLAMRYSSTPERAEHTVSLITSFLYHLLLCAWVAIVVALIVLPRAKGI